MSDIKNGRYVEYGFVLYYKNNLLHRENGPAIECENGTTVWCLNGKKHREDGPAVMDAKGTLEYWIHGTQYTEKEFNFYLEKKELQKTLPSDLTNLQGESKKTKI